MSIWFKKEFRKKSFIGVYPFRDRIRWQARIAKAGPQGKTIYLGVYNSRDEAVIARFIAEVLLEIISEDKTEKERIFLEYDRKRCAEISKEVKSILIEAGIPLHNEKNPS